MEKSRNSSVDKNKEIKGSITYSAVFCYILHVIIFCWDPFDLKTKNFWSAMGLELIKCCVGMNILQELFAVFAILLTTNDLPKTIRKIKKRVV